MSATAPVTAQTPWFTSASRYYVYWRSIIGTIFAIILVGIGIYGLTTPDHKIGGGQPSGTVEAEATVESYVCGSSMPVSCDVTFSYFVVGHGNHTYKTTTTTTYSKGQHLKIYVDQLDHTKVVQLTPNSKVEAWPFLVGGLVLFAIIAGNAYVVSKYETLANVEGGMALMGQFRNGSNTAFSSLSNLGL